MFVAIKDGYVQVNGKKEKFSYRMLPGDNIILVSFDSELPEDFAHVLKTLRENCKAEY